MGAAALFAGVDGGGSRTRALLGDAGGRVLGAGNGPPSNHYAVGADGAMAAIAGALAAAAAQAGLDSTPELTAACFGLAGVNRPADQELLERALRERGFAPRTAVVNDVELVLAAGTGGWGIALAAGTGSIGYGRARDGRTARAGGWGYILGDEGSGYSIASQALHLATQTADGRASAPRILGEVLRHWNLDVPEQLLGRVYRRDTTIGEIAALTSRILPLAEEGDAAAIELCDRAASQLAQVVDAVAQPLGFDAASPPALALAGGVLRSSPRIRGELVRRVRTPLGPSTVVVDPAEGALLLARRLAGAA
ncbi:MAG TPA: BadF/BadG/BcrA/BcrD ATPase family protein [Kofleriaceae bacterium]|nr:BadF/BadG/BcrA/BcrD ATPase family protein [Kofleriaceae bacterium]